MNTAGKIFAMLVWLGALAVAGSVVLALTAARVGEHKSSTYGNAYTQFQNSWGGEIAILPPEFGLLRTYTVSEYNKDSKIYEDVEKTERIPLIPKSIKIDSVVNYGEQERDLLIFNAFEAQNTETYVVANTTGYAGELLTKVTKPVNANLMYDYRISIPSEGNAVIRPVMDKSVSLVPALDKGQQVEIILTYTTKGMDIFKYNLSAFQNSVIEGLQAKVKLNTKEFDIYRFGLPHTTEFTSSGATIQFNVDDFSTTQDLGITFISKQRYLDQIQSLMNYSPISLILFLVVIFFFSQIYAIKFNPFHYLFSGHDRCVLLFIRCLPGALLWDCPHVWDRDRAYGGHVLPVLPQCIWLALCHPDHRCLSVPAHGRLLAHLHDANLPRTSVCDPDLPGLYVDHELCEPLRHFKMADSEPGSTYTGH